MYNHLIDLKLRGDVHVDDIGGKGNSPVTGIKAGRICLPGNRTSVAKGNICGQLPTAETEPYMPGKDGSNRHPRQ
jgi:hypothetical protein